MARRRRAARTVTRFVRRQARRRGSKNDVKKYAKKAGFGAVAGLAVAIPLTLLGKHLQQPLLIEAGQRAGSVASAAAGGPIGNAAFQGADALFDRFVMVDGGSVSGSSGMVYL